MELYMCCDLELYLGFGIVIYVVEMPMMLVIWRASLTSQASAGAMLLFALVICVADFVESVIHV